jgi:NTE family protein
MIKRPKDKSNLAFVLGGGAARGAYHLGVLYYCEQKGINIKAYSGSSIGAIIASAHASGISAKKQLEIYKSKEIKQAIKFNYFKNGLLKIDHQHEMIEQMLPLKNLQDIPREVYINAYDTKKKQLHYFNSGDTITLCMAASALIPLFKPIKYENMNLIDGGLFDRLPVKPLTHTNYDILAIDLFPRRVNKSNSNNLNPIKAIKKSLFKDLRKNHQYSMEHTNYYLTSMQLREFSLFTFKEIDECFNLGFKEAKNFFI